MAKKMIDRIKRKLEDTEVSEDLLEDLIDDATVEVLGRTNQEELNAELEIVVVDSVVLHVNRLGTEALKSENYSGVSYSYLFYLPDHLQTLINHNSRLGRWD